MKIDRLMAILLYLLSRDKVTAREMASYFGVTLRTIYRDMDALSLAGVPIASYQGVEGGYGLVESFRLDRTFFKEGELLAVLSALKGINAAIKDSSIEAALLKLKALSPRKGAGRETPEELPTILYVPIPWGGSSDWGGRLQTVRTAIENRRVVSYTYTKTDGRSSRRRVEPMTVVLQADIWYLYAWDIAKKDYRFFRFSRISELETEGVRFTRRAGSRPYPWETSWESEPEVRIRLKVSPEAGQKARDAFPWENPDLLRCGSLLFTLRFPYSDWVERQILSFGPHVEVVEPEWLRKKILELARGTASKYEKEP